MREPIEYDEGERPDCPEEHGPEPPWFKPVDLAAKDVGPPLAVNRASQHAVDLRNRLSWAVRKVDDEDTLRAVAALLGVTDV